MSSTTEFGAMKIGKKTLQDAVLDLGTLKAANKTYGNKAQVLKALANKDIATLREISNYFYRTSGIYFRICNYFAQMYRYDWYIVPEVYDKEAKPEKVTGEFHKVLNEIGYTLEDANNLLDMGNNEYTDRSKYLESPSEFFKNNN